MVTRSMVGKSKVKEGYHEERSCERMAEMGGNSRDQKTRSQRALQAARDHRLRSEEDGAQERREKGKTGSRKERRRQAG